jgi:hypothetical protein
MQFGLLQMASGTPKGQPLAISASIGVIESQGD